MKTEWKVGVLFILSMLAILVFSYYLGVINPFSNTETVVVSYNFAGGIEEGSPVRVMGIKAGKVTHIEFEPGMIDSKGGEVNLKLSLAVDKKALKTLKEDSKFFINLAGVIGERYVEITPGSKEAANIDLKKVYRGEDPPRIDQLISQSYALAGKIISLVEENEGDVVQLLSSFNQLVGNLNKSLALLQKLDQGSKLGELVSNLVQVTGDVSAVSGKLRGKDAEKTLDLLHRLIWRLDELDKKAIQQFLQEEGIKAKIF